ncbi:glucose-6-phosphate isomerase [Striga asiatica]|uniref:Glucose-6-phosphate isomerase n=1 Tax=Striga asiatica TaxID=4170 RepID=A0A5A7QBI9_STRAF|nr:glucose-6-phosphate isomerase [Striga asiatica]
MSLLWEALMRNSPQREREETGPRGLLGWRGICRVGRRGFFGLGENRSGKNLKGSRLALLSSSCLDLNLETTMECPLGRTDSEEHTGQRGRRPKESTTSMEDTVRSSDLHSCSSASLASACPSRSCRLLRCMYTTQSPFPLALLIGITYPVSPPHGKWYDPNSGPPHPKFSSWTGNLSPDDTTTAASSFSSLQYTFTTAGFGLRISTQSISAKKCSAADASATHPCTASAAFESGAAQRAPALSPTYGIERTFPKYRSAPAPRRVLPSTTTPNFTALDGSPTAAPARVFQRKAPNDSILLLRAPLQQAWDWRRSISSDGTR